MPDAPARRNHVVPECPLPELQFARLPRANARSANPFLAPLSCSPAFRMHSSAEGTSLPYSWPCAASCALPTSSQSPGDDACGRYCRNGCSRWRGPWPLQRLRKAVTLLVLVPRAQSRGTPPYHPPFESARESSATIPHPAPPRRAPPNALSPAAPAARVSLPASPERRPSPLP